MKYDFNVIPDRSHCGSSKWNAVPGASVDKVPLSTADMEFPVAPEIAQELKRLIDTTVLGYTGPTKEYFDAVCGWMKRRHGYEVDPSHIILTPGVVNALALLVESATKPGENVIIMNPVYYPFDLAVLAKGRNIVYNPLKLNGDRYEIDFDDLEKKAARPDCTALLFCNPHNPIGRVWTKEELERVVDICARNHVFIIDDEIHNDLVMPGYKHTVMAALSDKARQICAVCTAPSKTFNLAGLQCSNIIVDNDEIRAKMQVNNLCNMNMHLNIFAYTACQAAYNKGEAWLGQLIEVVRSNADYIKDFLAENIPEAKVYPLEGTYLLWVDFGGLGMTHPELEDMMKNEAGLYLDEGYIFGDGGRGFERFNLACSPVTIARSMERLKKAVDGRRAKWAAEGKPCHTTLKKGDAVEGFVYDTPSETGLKLDDAKKPTIIVFSRYYTCSVCQAMMSRLKAAYPTLSAAGFDLKVVLQSTRESLLAAEAEKAFPFELICDPDCRLYDRYNVFEADSAAAMIAGDPMINQLGVEGIKNLIGSMFTGGGSKPEGRQRQLQAIFVVSPDCKVLYAHYAKTMSDFPDMAEVIKNLK